MPFLAPPAAAPHCQRIPLAGAHHELVPHAPFLTAGVLVSSGAAAQGRGGLTPEQTKQRWDLENELQSLAIVERKLMIPMRDGMRIATDVYRPKDASKKYPTIFVRTPYNFNFWDVRNGAPRDMTAAARRGEARLRVRRR